MRVDLLDLNIQYRTIENEIKSVIESVLNSSRYIMGPNVYALEEEIANYIGVKYALGVSSGTDALLLLLKAYAIGIGDEVITSPFTFFASAEVTEILGATPVFADIEEDTLCIDPKSIERCITERTKAIIPIHIFGQMCDMDAIMANAKKHNLIVKGDAC